MIKTMLCEKCRAVSEKKKKTWHTRCIEEMHGAFMICLDDVASGRMYTFHIHVPLLLTCIVCSGLIFSTILGQFYLPDFGK